LRWIAGSHQSAGLGTSATFLSAATHHLVIRKVLAADCAAHADIGADGAGLEMKFRSAQHEIRAGLANLNAIRQQTHMEFLRVFAPFLQTMDGGLNTQAVALQAFFNAIAHFRCDVAHGRSLITLLVTFLVTFLVDIDVRCSANARRSPEQSRIRSSTAEEQATASSPCSL
jgi:hypothetical protein